jgi:hypothetical protein
MGRNGCLERQNQFLDIGSLLAYMAQWRTDLEYPARKDLHNLSWSFCGLLKEKPSALFASP